MLRDLGEKLTGSFSIALFVSCIVTASGITGRQKGLPRLHCADIITTIKGGLVFYLQGDSIKDTQALYGVTDIVGDDSRTRGL